MAGRRSTDRNFLFGYPTSLDTNKLPTDSDIVSHSLFLKREKVASEEWRNNTPLSVISSKVADDVSAVWSKTDIPHHGTINKKWVREKVEKLLARSKEVLKIPSQRRNDIQLSQVWGTLFDISLCPHRAVKTCDCPHCEVPHPERCTCPPDTRVPDSWQPFLWDQRQERVWCLATIDRQKLKEERDRLDAQVRDMDRKESKKMKLDQQRTREAGQLDPAPDSELVDSQGDRLSSEGSDSDDSEESDSEEETHSTIEYNTLQLRRFSRECDRYKTSNRAGAKIANGLLKDLAIVTESDKKFLVCPNKLRRERLKWGQKIVDKHSARNPPGTRYFI